MKLRSNTKSPFFTKKEITEWLSNAVIRALKPASLGTEIPEIRLKKLRAYAQGLIAPLLKHADEGLVRPEEIVVILLAGALFVQISQVLGSDKVPAGALVNEIFEGKNAVVLPELYFETPDPAGEDVLPRKAPKGKKRV